MSDYIDRKAVKDWLLRWEGYIDKDTITRMQYRVIDIPSVEVEPVKHGRWTPVTNGRGGFECSICHSYAPSYQDGVEWLSRYCPNCGAKMEAAPTIIEAEGEEE